MIMIINDTFAASATNGIAPSDYFYMLIHMQYSAIKSMISDYIVHIIDTFADIFITHPDYYIHRILAIITCLLIYNVIRTNRLRNQLNDIDKRTTLSLLTIQHYCTAINRAVNEVIETNKTISTENTKITNHIRLAHQRVKDAYTGVFKHFDIKRIRRAPKITTQEQREKHEKEMEDHNALIRETTDEMLTTELHY